jgi:hypothetical protein
VTLPDRDTLATYGGPMANYNDPVDPTTDEDASFRNKYAANVAMMTHTVARAARSFLGSTGGATQIADPTSGFVHDALWGDTAAVKPNATYIATGTYDVIWPATVADELAVQHTLGLRRAWAQVESSDGTLRIANAKVTGARTVRVYTYECLTANGLTYPSQLVASVITVFVL